ncbi:MAG TPA: DUF6263 family protein [Acidobacteriota bacterium]
MMIVFVRLTAALLILVVSLGCTAARPAAVATPLPPRQVTLGWKLDPGVDLVYVQAISSETDMPQAMGTMTSEFEFTHRWTVADTPGADGESRVRLTFERLRATIRTPMGTMAVDSDDPAASSRPGLEGLAAIAGSSYVMVLGPNGEVRAIEGLDQVRQQLAGATDNPMAAALLSQGLSDEGIRNNWEQGLFRAFPADPVEPGSTWEHTANIQTPMPGAMDMSTTYTLESIEDRDGIIVAVISNVGTVDIAPGAAMPAVMELGTMATTGTTEFDVNRGVLLRSQATTTMEMRMSMGGRELVIASTGTMTMELQDHGRQR